MKMSLDRESTVGRYLPVSLIRFQFNSFPPVPIIDVVVRRVDDR